MSVIEVYQQDEQLNQCLFEALYELMQTTPIDRISVSDITMQAHVSRASFYRRYQDKYDLLNSSYEKILENTLFTVQKGSSWRDAIYKIYAVIQEHAKFFHNAFCSTDQNSLRNYIFERTMRLELDILADQGVNTDDTATQYRLHAYVAGGLELTVAWVQDGAVFPLDDIVDIFVENVPDKLKQYFLGETV
jgi:AcrR family transcriptional regulator